MKKPIGILGGTFDPIHFGHLRSALEILQILDFAEVRLIPCNSPVHKNGNTSSVTHRLAMLHLAVNTVPQLKIDEREIRRSSPSYMIDTLLSLREEFPETPLCLIVGTDSFNQLPTWHRFGKILDLVHIVVATRPSFEYFPTPEHNHLTNNHLSLDREDLHQQKQGSIYFQMITQLDISATAIRQQTKAGYDPHFLTPCSVIEYIKKNDLYL